LYNTLGNQVRASKEARIVLSMQALISQYCHHFQDTSLGSLTRAKVIRNLAKFFAVCHSIFASLEQQILKF
jgi:hypothetical protein